MIASKVSAILDKIRARKGTTADFDALYAYLQNPDNNLDTIYSAVSLYLEFAPNVDWNIAVKYATFPDDPMISAAAIMTAAIRRCPERRFWDQVREIAMGVDWDPENCARVQAIFAVSQMPGGCQDAREVIQYNLLSDWESVRDSAATAAQRCFGRREEELITEGVSGRLIEMVGPDVLNWIWPEREKGRRLD